MRWSDGRSRGFGYITYDNADSANEALKAPQTLDGRPVDVKRAVPGTNKLFVGGLPQGVSAAELRTYFSNFGPVSDAVVMMDSATGRSRGFGFVCFAPGPQGATAISAALATYDQHQLRGKWVEVKSAAPPQELNKCGGDVPPELLLPPSTPSSLQSAPITPSMANYSPGHSMLGYTPCSPPSQLSHRGVSSPHSLLQHRGLPLMSASAPEFVPTADDLMYGHLMQADPYAQHQMPLELYPGGRPPATPHSDRSLAEEALNKRAFSAVRSLEHKVSMVPPPPQHAPMEPQWPLFAPESSAAAVQVVPAPPAGLPGDAAAGFSIATGFGTADTESEVKPAPVSSPSVVAPMISPKLPVARPPPGLEDEAPMCQICEDPSPLTLACNEVQSVMKDMSTQTEGPACKACGAQFGCAGKCPWPRDQLLRFREAFLRTQVEPKASNALQAVRYPLTPAARTKVGGA